VIRLLLLAPLLAGCADIELTDPPEGPAPQYGDWCKHMCTPGTVRSLSSWTGCSFFEPPIVSND
jgi:hypothetical protein